MAFRVTHKVTGVAVLCLAAAVVALALFHWSGWAQSWLSGQFKILAGGVVGYLISSKLLGLDLSKVAKEQRALAGIAQAIIVAGGMIAGAVVA